MEKRIFSSLPEDARQIRERVFVEEQGFRYEFDDIDRVATHFVFYDEGVPVATCRVFWSDARACYILGRLAVEASYRGRGYGSLVLREGEAYIRALGGKKVALHAQCRATPFYEGLGYEAFGEVENEEFCPHIWMGKRLD